MPDRYAEAVRARRVELRVQRDLLTGGHRAELRSCLALSRLTAAAAANAAMADLARETRVHIEGADRSGRAQFPDRLAAAVDDVAVTLHAGWAAELRPALRRIATARNLTMGLGWPRLPAPHRPGGALPPLPEPTTTAWSLLTGAADGAALWRLALFPLAMLPLLGLPALGGPALAPLAVGTGVVAIVLAVWFRRAAAERSRLRRHAEDVLAAVRAALDADLGRRLLELERTAGAALDAEVARRRAVLDAELRMLAPDRSTEVPSG
ncbi:MAG: hypothetical protein ACR2GH_17200 [Pseudonocardia sp.]